MKNTEPDIPVERLDGDIGISFTEGCDEYREADQEINNPPGYKEKASSEPPSLDQSWSDPLGYTPGVW